MGVFLSSLFIFGVYIMFSGEAQAYLDLGTGSYVFQMALGAILGGIFTLKLYYHKIIKLFKKSSKVETKVKKDEGK